MARERYGNGYRGGRAATRRRMTSHHRGYVGTSKALGHASRRVAQPWTYGKSKAWR
jgi:hypothetical protein